MVVYMKYRKNFSEKLKELRKARGMTQREVAEKIDVSISMYSKYEQGLNYPSEVTLLSLTNFFNVSINGELLVDLVMPTQDKRHCHMRIAVQINSMSNKLTKTPYSPNTSTLQLSASQPRQLANPRAHQLTNPQLHPTYKLAASSTYELTNASNPQACQLANSQSHQFPNLQTHQLTTLSTCKHITLPN